MSSGDCSCRHVVVRCTRTRTRTSTRTRTRTRYLYVDISVPWPVASLLQAPSVCFSLYWGPVIATMASLAAGSEAAGFEAAGAWMPRTGGKRCWWDAEERDAHDARLLVSTQKPPRLTFVDCFGCVALRVRGCEVGFQFLLYGMIVFQQRCKVRRQWKGRPRSCLDRQWGSPRWRVACPWKGKPRSGARFGTGHQVCFVCCHVYPCGHSRCDSLWGTCTLVVRFR